MDAKPTSHGSEATSILTEMNQMANSLNLALTDCDSKHNEFPMPLGQRIAQWKLVNSNCCLKSVKMTWAKIIEPTWNLKQYMFKCSANQGLYTLPCFLGRLQADSVRPDLSRILNFWLGNGWNCPVTFQCMLAGLVSLMDFSGGQSSWNITKPAGKSTRNH